MLNKYIGYLLGIRYTQAKFSSSSFVEPEKFIKYYCSKTSMNEEAWEAYLF